MELKDIKDEKLQKAAAVLLELLPEDAEIKDWTNGALSLIRSLMS